MSFSFRSAVLATVGLAIVATPAAAQVSPERVQEIREVLLAHPEIITEVMAKARENDRKREVERLNAGVRPVAAEILKGDKQIAFVGPATGQPIIEFFDYNCGFCKRFHSETASVLKAEGKTKLILVHTPILGPGSVRLAEFAAAANLQGKFGPAHDFLIQHSAKDATEADQLVDQLIATAKLDRAKFQRALADGSARAQVDHNLGLATKAGVQGTPLVFANNTAIPGAIPIGPLKNILAN